MIAEQPLDVVIVGATRAVGEKLIGLLAETRIAVSNLKLVASGRSVGRHRVNFRGQSLLVTDFLQTNRFDFDPLFFSAGGPVSTHWMPRLAAEGALGNR